MNKNILLIFPKTGYDLKGVSMKMPMGLMCIAAPLAKEGCKVSILDQRTEKDFFRKIEAHLNGGPICVGITALTGLQILYALKIAEFVRQRSRIPIVWGGVHPTLTADQTLRNKNVDIIVRGEGELTFLELVNALCLKKSLSGIKGISWRDGNAIHHNPEREFCDLNKFANPSYDLVEMERYITPGVPDRKRSLDVYTSRGCPHGCIFCYNVCFNKSSYRKKNIDRVVQEIEWLAKRYRLDSIYIGDDNFFVDVERAHSFCRSLMNKKIIPEWGCLGVRIDSLEKIDFDLLEKSGCKQLFVGIESGSEEILSYIKKNITIKQIKDIISRFSRSKIIAHYNFMVGYPTEGMGELSETVALADHIMRVDPKAHFSSFHLLTPYPGTDFYEILVKQYGFMPPSSLEEWAHVRWEREHASWIPPKTRKVCLNLTLLTYFIDGKALDQTRNNILLRMLAWILIVLAKLHWKYGKFEFCPEFTLLNRLVNYKMMREIKAASQ